jgi:methylated-DNA-[protein]-cysteine S-methyltransferase
MATLARASRASPIGPLRIDFDEAGAVRALAFTSGPAMQGVAEAPLPGAIDDALDRYFAGDVRALDAVEVRPVGTAFQQAVWAALRTIPPGATTSYGGLAAALGRPGASRAVGLANGANPIAIVVPCHRLVGADGSLTGYGGGLERKRWLLDHERRWTDVDGG